MMLIKRKDASTVLSAWAEHASEYSIFLFFPFHSFSPTALCTNEETNPLFSPVVVCTSPGVTSFQPLHSPPSLYFHCTAHSLLDDPASPPSPHFIFCRHHSHRTAPFLPYLQAHTRCFNKDKRRVISTDERKSTNNNKGASFFPSSCREQRELRFFDRCGPFKRDKKDQKTGGHPISIMIQPRRFHSNFFFFIPLTQGVSMTMDDNAG